MLCTGGYVFCIMGSWLLSLLGVQLPSLLSGGWVASCLPLPCHDSSSCGWCCPPPCVVFFSFFYFSWAALKMRCPGGCLGRGGSRLIVCRASTTWRCMNKGGGGRGRGGEGCAPTLTPSSTLAPKSQSHNRTLITIPRAGGILGIGITLGATALAAANLLLDFDMIKSAARRRAMPKWFEW